MKQKTWTSLFCIISSACLFGQNWSQTGNTLIGENSGDLHGNSCDFSFDGNTMAVGAFKNSENGFESGQVRVYEFNGSSWNQIGQDLNGTAVNDEFGRSVSLSRNGDTLAVGAWSFLANAGYVKVYTFNGSLWTQVGSTLQASSSDTWFGTSVNLSKDGTVLAIGEPAGDIGGADIGNVRVYKLTGGAWTQVGNMLQGESAGDYFGYSVRLSADGNRLVAGAYGNDANGANSGSVRVFDLVGSTWTQIGADIDGEAANDQSGAHIECNFDASIVMISSWWNDGNGANSGSVRVYEYQGGSWVQLGQDIDGEAAGDQFGNSIAMNYAGNIIAAGANNNDGNGSNSGHVRVYKFNGTSWQQIGSDVNGANAGDDCGSSLAMDSTGYKFATGSRYNNDNGTNSGHIRAFEYPNCGAVATGTEHIVACFSYTWINGITYFSSNNTATHTLFGAADNGCDSTVMLDLIINQVDNSTTLSGITISSNQTGASYQWLNCNNAMSPVSGANNSAFTPEFNGSYAVEVTVNGCIDTSGCVAISSIGWMENSFDAYIEVYPNPTQGDIHIQFPSEQEMIKLTLYDINGNEVQNTVVFNTASALFSIAESGSGVYVLVISDQEGHRASLRVIRSE